MKLPMEAIVIAAQCWCDPRTENIEMDSRLAEVFAERLVAEHQRLMEIVEFGWGIIANANGGNWETLSQEWKEAAWRFEKQFYTNIWRSTPDATYKQQPKRKNEMNSGLKETGDRIHPPRVVDGQLTGSSVGGLCEPYHPGKFTKRFLRGKADNLRNQAAQLEQLADSLPDNVPEPVAELIRHTF